MSGSFLSIIGPIPIQPVEQPSTDYIRQTHAHGRPSRQAEDAPPTCKGLFPSAGHEEIDTGPSGRDAGRVGHVAIEVQVGREE